MRRATIVVVVWLVAVAAFGEMGKPRTDLNLRSAPNARRSSVVTVLGTSDRLDILETRRGWYRVRVIGTGAEGWVAKKYVEPIADPAPQAAGENETQRGDGMATGVIVALIAALLAAVGYAVGRQPQGKGNPLPVFVASMAIGTFYVGLTLPKAMITIGTARQWSTVARLGEWSFGLNQQMSAGLPAFPTLMRYVLWAVLLYLGSLLVLAIRHGQLDLFTWGAGMLAISVAIFHVITWTGYIAAKVLMFIWWVVRAIGGFFGTIIGYLFSLVIAAFVGIYHLLQQLMSDYWLLIPVVLVVVLGCILLKSQSHALDILKLIGGLVLLAGGGGIAFIVIRWIWHWIGTWVVAVLKFLALLFFRILVGVGVVLAVTVIGQLLIDQVQGALSAGRRRRGVIIGALSMGASIAILLFVSNLYGVCAWLPSAATEFAERYLHQPAPLLDALIALGLVSLSIVGVWRNVPALGEEPTAQEFGKSLVYSVAGVFVTGALVSIAGETEN